MDIALGGRRRIGTLRDLTTAAPGTGVCLWAGAVAPFLFIPLLLLAGRATPGYGHMASTFSDASSQGSPHPEFMTAGLVIVSAAILFCGVGLGRTLTRLAKVVQAGMTITAGSILMTAWFRDYNRASYVPRNREGLLHNTFAVVAVFAILLTILAIALALRNQPGWDHLSTPGLAVVIIVSLAGLAFTWGPDSHDGLAERILAGTAFAYLSWVSLTGLAVIRGMSLRETLAEPYPAAVPARVVNRQ